MVIEAGCPPHHWVIDAAQGTTSRGVCAKCGEEKQFANASPHESLWLRKNGVRPKDNQP